MSYENPHAAGTQALRSLDYSISSHGDLSAHYDSLINADVPSYAGRFYSPTEHEQISDLKYKKIEVGYDQKLKEITKALDGMPIEAYIPQTAENADTGSSSPTIRPKDIIITNPHKDVIAEIVKAQREAAGREIMLKELYFEETIIKRKFRSREIVIKEKDI
ncbi:MAG: hypothetical protein ABIC04_07415 [Nanoarchaeota archaeon]